MSTEYDDSRGEARQSFFAKQLLVETARAAFQLLAAVIKNATLYPEAHPILLTASDKLRRKLEELMTGRKEAAFYLVGGEVFFEKISVPTDQGLALLIEQFVAREVGGVVFRPGISAEELSRFASLMNRDAVLFTVQGGLEDALGKARIFHIDLHRMLVVDKMIDDTIKSGKKKASEVFKEAIDSVKEMVLAVRLDKTFSMRKTNSIVHTMVDSVLDNQDAFLGLTSLKMYDEYTFAHSVNTAILSVSLGTFLSFEKSQIAALGVAGLMHDIGKVYIPREIINKPGKLTAEEWEAVKRHPVEGALLLANTQGVSKLAMVAAFEHHQHGDVRGYPKTEEEVHQHAFSQIVALADAYDALTAARVYYSVQMPPDQAVRILLSKRGSAFNPVLVKAFVNMIGIFPIGTLLKLDTGQLGLVTHQTRDLLRPRVLLLTKFDGSEKDYGLEVSLLETTNGRYKRSIFGTINPHEVKIDLKKYLV
jgi:HD-GYP domain-containing protein (c-di-GMP phosphodiesterase class II)